MRISVAIVLITMGAIVVATAMYLYAEVSRGPDSLPKQAAMPIPAPTATLEPVPTPTGAVATAVPARTPTAVSGGPVLPQIPFPSLAAQRTPRPGETASILNPRTFDELPDSLLLRQRDPEIYHSIARLSWVLDGISRMESDPAQALIALGLEDPASASALLRIPWLAGDLSMDEAWTVGALGFLAFDAPDAFERMMDMPWIADGISVDESWAISSLSDIAMESRDAANSLASYHWFADGIDTDEVAAVTMLGSISYETDSAAKLIGMRFLDSIEPADPFALNSLEILAYEEPTVFRRILSHPAVADGITDHETTALALLHDVQETNPDMVNTLLDPSAIQIERRDIRLPLAGDIQLAIVRIQPGAARSMELLESSVRFAEDFMDEPFPTNFVLLLYADAVILGYSGHNAGLNMTIHPDFDTDDNSDEAYQASSLLTHEVAHYYWGNSAQMWLDEGAAELIAIIHEESTTGQETWGMANTFPCSYASDLSAVERLDGSLYDDCAYSIGTRFFLDLYRTLNKDEFQKGFRELYLLGKDIFDPEDPDARGIDHVRDAFDFSEGASDEIIPKWYWSRP